MIRKSYTIGILGLALLLVGAQPTARHRITTSAQNFQQYFNNLKGAGNSLNPIERFVFSLVLANTNPAQAAR